MGGGSSLSTATFDTDLAAAGGAGQLAIHHAVLFNVSAGSLPATLVCMKTSETLVV